MHSSFPFFPTTVFKQTFRMSFLIILTNCLLHSVCYFYSVYQPLVYSTYGSTINIYICNYCTYVHIDNVKYKKNIPRFIYNHEIATVISQMLLSITIYSLIIIVTVHLEERGAAYIYLTKWEHCFDRFSSLLKKNMSPNKISSLINSDIIQLNKKFTLKKNHSI